MTEPEAITEMRGAGDRYVLCLNADRMRQVVAYVDALSGTVKAAKVMLDAMDTGSGIEEVDAIAALRSKLAVLEIL